MALNRSNTLLACFFSSSLTGFDSAMPMRNLSASLPDRAGVSLMGLAIMVLFNLVCKVSA